MTKRLEPSTFIKQESEVINEAVPAMLAPIAMAGAMGAKPIDKPNVAPSAPAGNTQKAEASKPPWKPDGSISFMSANAHDTLWHTVNSIAQSKCSNTYSRAAVEGIVNRLEQKNVVQPAGPNQFRVSFDKNTVDAIAGAMTSAYNQAVSGK